MKCLESKQAGRQARRPGTAEAAQQCREDGSSSG